MPHAGNAARLTGFTTLRFLSLGVGAYAIAIYGFMRLGALVHPDMRTPFLADRFGIYSHVFGSIVALALGPFQFSARIRSAA